MTFTLRTPIPMTQDLTGSAFPLMAALMALFLPMAAHAVSDQGVIGWDGDKNAGLALLDGTIGIRGRPELNLPGPDLRWGIRGVCHAIAKELPASTKIAWSNAEGWLPALVTRFEKDGCTITITNFGLWTLDNFSALQGLGCYAYICRRLGNAEELKWAETQYQSLLSAVEAKLTSLSPDVLSNRMDGFAPGSLPARIDASYDWLAKNQGFKSPRIWAEPWGGTPEHPAFFSVYSAWCFPTSVSMSHFRVTSQRARFGSICRNFSPEKPVYRPAHLTRQNTGWCSLR